MPDNSLKGFIRVTAGVIPGQPMAEYGKLWNYTSGDYAKDRETAPELPTIFSGMLDQAHEYAKGLSNPAYVNWVRVDWLWV